MEKRFDSVINKKILSFVAASEWPQMLDYLNSLSNSRFRTASYILAESVLAQIDNNKYWQCFSNIATSNTKAFLITFLKAAVSNYRKGTLTFSAPEFTEFAQSTQGNETSLDRQKTLLFILHELNTCQEVEEVLESFCGSSANLKMYYLVNSAESKQCYYVMFQLMRRHEVENDIIQRYLRMILRRSTPMAFNFVSMMREYFDIAELSGQFSLTLQPYELSRIENKYETFVETLTRL